MSSPHANHQGEPGDTGWSDLSPQDVVRRTRCRAESFSTHHAEIWRLCCDEILSRLGPEGPPAMSEWEALEVIGQLPAALTADEHASAFRSAATRCASTAPARSRRLDARADKIEAALRTLQTAGEVR